MSPERSHAIVIGGSMAGLLAARVLSGHFKQVTLIERDTLPDQPVQRRGVPQGRHAHGLLAGGSVAIEGLFPGFFQSLVERGAVTGDLVRDSRWFSGQGYLSRPASRLRGLLATRPLLEAAVRERVISLPNVTVRENVTVESLLANEARDRVVGVQTDNAKFRGDLVIDATGRGSHTPRWLESLGYEKPGEDAVQVALGYTTRYFRRTPQDLDGDLLAIITPTPEGKSGGVLAAQEGDRWILTLIGHFGNYAPEDLDGFIEFSRTLPAPDIYEVIRNAEPLGEPASARFPASIRRRYENLSRFPAGYLVMGDAMCSFNPIYGQGMSVAALEAVELDRILAGGAQNITKKFFVRAAKVVDTPWSIAVGNDLRMPEAIGRRTPGANFINWYIAKLHRAAQRDPVPSLAFHRVGNLLAPPQSLMHPRVAARVLLGNLRMSFIETMQQTPLRRRHKETTF